ncbi:hypothetical protein KFV02_02445 [Desulfohalobiaceae bacterium Ax17]|uniref:hypothetical protein n=1 Tax=Desulfovulcanus ferrireducens TaxID=2831190 RepID=UPI00207BA0C1|nr:hypothetical protein [Desulfovulcanus ferrireducens]MBT8762789.1 hypothetical protein [Desulfovulcanus ferrireducens]
MGEIATASFATLAMTEFALYHCELKQSGAKQSQSLNYKKSLNLVKGCACKKGLFAGNVEI